MLQDLRSFILHCPKIANVSFLLCVQPRILLCQSQIVLLAMIYSISTVTIKYFVGEFCSICARLDCVQSGNDPFRPRTQNNPESRNIVSMRGNSISSSDRCKRHLGTENRGGGWGEVTHTFSQLFIYLIITTATFGPIKKGKSQSIGVLFPDFSVH